MIKSIARKQLIAQRKNLMLNECLKMDDLLLIQFQKLDWSNVHCVANFYPLEQHNEPNTLLLAKYLKAIIPGIRMAYPISDTNNLTMNFYAETQTLHKNAYGIMEPMPSQLIEPASIDVVLVPLIGFDRAGHRIGFGKGFYDKYFNQFPSNRPRIGVSYFEPVPNIQDTHEFDVPLTHCITPWNSYEF
jgi:5-formyltetrahydrofolate cyclo-ligase